MKQNKLSKTLFILIAVLTLALFMAINMTGLLTIGEQSETKPEDPQVFNWQSRSFDFIILAFFLIGGALASLRVLPLRKVDPDE